jgi:hypothetical protein
MAVTRSGLAGQIGFADEVTPGTAVTPTLFLPFVDEGIEGDRPRVESDAIQAGRRVVTSNMWNGGNHSFAGPIGLELYDRGLVKLFKHMFGNVVTTGAGPYNHTVTPGDLDGKSLTVQVGRPGVAGTVHPFTYAGVKITEWEIAVSAGEIATLGLDVIAMTETTATALAASTPVAGLKPVKFNHGAITIGGTAFKVKSATLKGSNGLDDDRRFIGTQTIDEPLEAELREYSGTLELEFVDLTHHARFVAGSEHAMVLAFTIGAHSMTITTNIRYDGSNPTVGGKGILSQSLPFKCVATAADATAITVVIVDSTITA